MESYCGVFFTPIVPGNVCANRFHDYTRSIFSKCVGLPLVDDRSSKPVKL